MAHLSVKSLLIISFMLGSTAAGFAFKTFQQAAELASVAADLAQSRAALSASKKALKTEKAQSKKALAKQKAKGRLKRIAIAVPVVGSMAAISFEAYAYNQWKTEHPCGTVNEYGEEIATASSEVIDDVLLELPADYRPSPGTTSKWTQKLISMLPEDDPTELPEECRNQTPIVD